MTSATSYPAGHRSDLMLWIASVIHSHGIAVLNIGSGDCSVPGCACGAAPVPWSYSIGFHERGHPEVVVFGREPDEAITMLNWMRRRESTGRAVTPGSIILLDGNWVRFDPVPAAWITGSEDPMGTWFAHYGVGMESVEPPEVLQLVWADAGGRFPDEEGCDPDVVAVQPVGAALVGDWSNRSLATPRRGSRTRRAHRRRPG